jgi:hypothetical protein
MDFITFFIVLKLWRGCRLFITCGVFGRLIANVLGYFVLLFCYLCCICWDSFFLLVVDLLYYILYAEKGGLFLLSWTGRGAAVFFCGKGVKTELGKIQSSVKLKMQ